MRPFAVQPAKSVLGVLIIASVYSLILGERSYPYTLLFLLIALLVIASMLNRAATAIIAVLSCLVVPYFVIPPVLSFSMDSRGLRFFFAYCSVALVGCASIQLFRQVAVFTTGAKTGAAEQAASNSITLKCGSNGRLRYAPAELITFTGRMQNELIGFWWLDAVSAADRSRVVTTVRKGGTTRFRLRNSYAQYCWFELSVSPRTFLVGRFLSKTLVLLPERSN